MTALSIANGPAAYLGVKDLSFNWMQRFQWMLIIPCWARSPAALV